MSRFAVVDLSPAGHPGILWRRFAAFYDCSIEVLTRWRQFDELEGNFDAVIIHFNDYSDNPTRDCALELIRGCAGRFPRPANPALQKYWDRGQRVGVVVAFSGGTPWDEAFPERSPTDCIQDEFKRYWYDGFFSYCNCLNELRCWIKGRVRRGDREARFELLAAVLDRDAARARQAAAKLGSSDPDLAAASTRELNELLARGIDRLRPEQARPLRALLFTEE